MSRLPLRGADLVLIAMQRLWPDERLSNNAILVVECDGRVAPERVRRAVDRFLDVCAWPAARLRRPFPWGKLHWAVGPREALVAPPVRHVSVASSAERHALFEDELREAIEPRRDPPLRIVIADAPAERATTGEPGGERTALVLTWFHPLMDPRGGQNLLSHLAYLDQHDDGVPWGGAPPAFTAARDSLPLGERGRLARRNLEYIRSLGEVPPVSPGTGLASPGPVRFRQEAFVEDASPRGGPRVDREMPWRLALVGKAMAELWKRRGLPDVPFLVPLSVDLRRKGDPEPTFGNALAFHFARFRPSDTADVDALERALRSQVADAVRDGQIEANAVALEFLHYRPTWMMLRELPGTATKETFSFNCADVGDFPPSLGSVFGRRVLNAYHVAAVLPRPGIGVFFNRCARRQNLVASWIEGAVSEAEVARIIETVREGMGWTRIV